MDELEFAAQFRPDGPVSVAQVLARTLATPDRAELEQDAAERAAAVEAEERRENLRLANYAAGDPLGQASRARAAEASARDEVRDLERRLGDAREVLSRAQSAAVEWGASADEILYARRSITPDLAAEAKRVAAEVRVEEMLFRAVRYPKECSGPGCSVCSAHRAAEQVAQ
jgi:hypothetical protein